MIRHLGVLAGLGVLMMAVFALPGCGFQPVYGGASFDSLRHVSVQVRGDDRFAYLVESAMRSRVGQASETAGSLTITLRTRQRRLGVSADGTATRVALETRARYQLRARGQDTLSGEAFERLAFEIPREPFALMTTFAEAERQAAEALAESLLQTIAADLRQRELAARRPDVRPDSARDTPDDVRADDLDRLEDLLGKDDDW